MENEKDFVTSERKVGIQSIFPDQNDPKHPPIWLSRAILWCILAFFVAYFAWTSFSKLTEVVTIVLISFFFAMALEPAVEFFEKFGINKKLATIVSIIIALIIVTAAILMFGSILIEQIVALLQTLPDIYATISTYISDTFHFQIPSNTDLIRTALDKYAEQLGTTVVFASFGLFTFVIDLLTIVLVVYFLCAEGDQFRASIAKWLPSSKQRNFIRIYTITQAKVGGFLGSRIILAVISITFTSIVCSTLGIPYWLALAVFMGVVGQFIPTVGVYIGCALPILVAFASKGADGPRIALILLVILVVYQNIENMFIMPIVSQEALDLNAAVAFISVLSFGYMFGPLGAFLALPVVATAATVLKLVGAKYETIDIGAMQVLQKNELKEMRTQQDAEEKAAKEQKKAARPHPDK
ncbi:MAG: AI-2E family transporter [Bifidobacteriaceae bacterium]|jgi:predicted PurR-regulated permease PerM|nr:AI-2E family transporter [Bifidobacteriaceae bacterium]